MDIAGLNNTRPINPSASHHETWLKNLQGNILSGHGRDHTVHLFLHLPSDVQDAKKVIAGLSRYVTSAWKQEIERQQYRDYRIPGALFGTLHLSASGYLKIGISEDKLKDEFPEDEDTGKPRSNFVEGMAKHAHDDFGDPPQTNWDCGFKKAKIDAMLLLADDDKDFLLREARGIMDALETQCDIVHVERGTALRNDDNEGIEHFGYVDGRSQPLFLSTDFQDLKKMAAKPIYGTRLNP